MNALTPTPVLDVRSVGHLPLDHQRVRNILYVVRNQSLTGSDKEANINTRSKDKIFKEKTE